MINAQVLPEIRLFAEKAHGSQKRKFTNDDYIVHPDRVVETLRSYRDDNNMFAAAFLHDVIEDTSVTVEQLEDFLHQITDIADAFEICTLVVELTDIYTKKSYPQLNRRARKAKEAQRLSSCSSKAQTIKYADIFDNTDVALHNPDFAKVYLSEAKNLLDVMTKGNPDLRNITITRVDDYISKFIKPGRKDTRSSFR